MNSIEKRAAALISSHCHSNPLVPGKTSGSWVGMPLNKAIEKLHKLDEEARIELEKINKVINDEISKERASYPKRTASDWAYIRHLKKIGVIK